MGLSTFSGSDIRLQSRWELRSDQGCDDPGRRDPQPAGAHPPLGVQLWRPAARRRCAGRHGLQSLSHLADHLVASDLGTRLAPLEGLTMHEEGFPPGSEEPELVALL